MTNEQKIQYVVNRHALPETYPTHAHNAYFWEYLGRTIATFGFLEEVLTRAIFAFTATRKYEETEIEEAYNQLIEKLEKTLSDQLGGLIDTYGKSVRDNAEAKNENLNDLLTDLRKASKIRNVLCHGSWGPPNQDGASIPFFVNNRKEIFETAVDISFLKRVQKHTSELACDVIDSVILSGWQFPGSTSPGIKIWNTGNIQQLESE